MRIRTIKPEFWTDEKVVQLSPFARLAFIGLWGMVDDEGRMEFSLPRIKMTLFPADNVSAAEICAELRKFALISTYSVEGHEYLQVTGFSKHQRIDHRRKSRFPAEPCGDFPGKRPRKGMEGNGREWNRTETTAASANAHQVVTEGGGGGEIPQPEQPKPAAAAEFNIVTWARIDQELPAIASRGLERHAVENALAGMNGKTAQALAVLAEACQDMSVRSPIAVLRRRLEDGARPDTIAAARRAIGEKTERLVDHDPENVCEACGAVGVRSARARAGMVGIRSGKLIPATCPACKAELRPMAKGAK